MSKKIDYVEKKFFFHNSTVSFYVNYIILITQNIYFFISHNIYFYMSKKTIMQKKNFFSQFDSIVLC